MSTGPGPPDRGYAAGLRALLAQMSLPYGFTLATFTSVGLAAHFKGDNPGPWEILLFLGGAFAGYLVMVVITTGLRLRVRPEPIPLKSWQMVHVLPLAVVFLLALLSAYVLPNPLLWFTNGLALTLGYVGCLAAVLWYLRGTDDAGEAT